MITIRKELDIPCAYRLSRLGDPERLLFFDIETTGLSAYSSSLYLIGCLYLRNGRFQFVQWLCEGLSDELPALRAFQELMTDFDALVHFNGDTFDLPYLRTTAEHYGCPDPFENIRLIDILKRVRKKKRFLDLPHYRLKSIERFLGIFRDDLYTGGELIEVYHRFERTKNEDLKHLLLLHNEDDLKGMIRILPILNYCDLLDTPGVIVQEAYTSASGSTLFVHGRLDDVFPTAVSYETLEGSRIEVSGRTIAFQIPCFLGEMKYFYPNAKDYYYLPKEDTAIHKKVASFVDPAFRKPATKETCYIRSSGRFLPALPNMSAPLFKTAWNDKKGCFKIDDADLQEYIHCTLKSI
ncbi:MAG: ribonuclease H-like domain-containing protein [Lachnospiraceae bacterium]|nr:ribonuclease H-like domain-containing protein [Lachnospiraceae bacterium]